MTDSKKFKCDVNLSGWSEFMNKKFTFCLILTFLLTAIATATTLNVPSGPYPTIQSAIADACDGDEVVVADGTYTGIGNRNLDFGGKSIYLSSVSGNPANCIIDCQGLGRAFYFHNGETPAAIVDGFTIKNGDAYYGGAIECEEASPTIVNCIITNNAAAYGGAIDCFYASPVIKNCIITNNFADDDGSAIECSSESSPEITNCLIIDNVADGYGAIDCYDESSPEIINCTIANNTGYAGRGGVYAAYLSLPTIRNSILWNNGDDIYGATATYSCIQDGDSGTGNISSYPLFKTGPSGDYYLSQTAAGQLPPDSNCVDAGGDSNDTIFSSGHSFATRTDNVPDSGIVDMGFHYPGGGAAVQCKLITAVDPNGNYGAIDPNWPAPAGHLYNQFTEVPLTAIPDDNSYTVEKWTGADNNNTAFTNVVTMDANHTVTVKFESTVMRNLTTYVVGANGTIDPYSAQPFVKYSPITINAQPTGGYVVKQWTKETSDPCTYTVIAGPNLPPDPNKYTIIIDSNTTVTVEFMENPVKYLLDTQVVSGHGTISPRRGYYSSGMVVPLTATPDYGYKVKQWGQDAAIKPAPKVNTNTVTMGPPSRLVTVEYEPKLQYKLITAAASGAIIDPNSPAPAGQLVYEDTVVPLTATIPPGSVVIWSGTDNDNTIALTNTVTMDANHTVNLNYHMPQVLHVPGQYPSISSAVLVAQSGDKIIVSQRIGNPYREWNIYLNGKIITISSEHPDDPCCVAATIIDCASTDGIPQGRAFILQNGEGPDTVIEGLTIINGSAIYNPQEPWDTDGHGQDGDDAFGGAIYCTNGASPTISNCVFKNCRAEGRRGENASYIFPVLPDTPEALEVLDPLDPLPTPGLPPPGPDPCAPVPGIDGADGLPGEDGNPGVDGIDGADGYDGGDGGHGYGGALYFDVNSNPKILHCKFIKCLAIGGNGGAGGLGQDGQGGQGGQDGQDGQEGQQGGPSRNSGPQGIGGRGGRGGAGGAGGAGGDGGNGGNGGNGATGLGGTIYFAGQK